MPRGRSYQVYVAPGARGQARARAAAKRINREAGREVVEIVYSPEKADVIIRMGQTPGKYAGYFNPRSGADVITLDPRANRKLAREGRQFETPLRRNLTMHELGHGLGLEHTDPKDMATFMDPSAVYSNWSEAQRREVRGQFEQGVYAGTGGMDVGDGEGAGIVERRRVVIDYLVNIPNSPPRSVVAPIVQNVMRGGRQMGFEELVEAVRRELIRQGSRNPDIFGGRA